VRRDREGRVFSLKVLLGCVLGAGAVTTGLFACTSGTRTLSDAERLRLGLTGVIYDARLCPTEYDESARQSRVSGECELVTCEPEKGKITCRARKEEPPRGRRAR
jgi:hypothetical protein